MSEYIVEVPDKPAKVVCDGWNVRIEWDFKQREEIVRCRDCKYYDPNDAPSDVYPDRYWCDKLDCYFCADEFCSRGKRKEGSNG